MRAKSRLRTVSRIVALALALNGLGLFVFALRWEHVSFNVDDAIGFFGGSAMFAWLMGWLD